jgi:hypothetical protein
MWLVSIEPGDFLGSDVRNFECPRCFNIRHVWTIFFIATNLRRPSIGSLHVQSSSPKWLKFYGPVLTARMTAVLLEHASGPRPTRAVMTELRVLRSLWERGLIRFNRRKRPTHSIATTRGREVISVLLAKPVEAPIKHSGERTVAGGFYDPAAASTLAVSALRH